MDTSFLLTESSDTQNERGEEYEEENELSADPCFNDSIFFDVYRLKKSHYDHLN